MGFATHRSLNNQSESIMSVFDVSELGFDAKKSGQVSLKSGLKMMKSEKSRAWSGLSRPQIGGVSGLLKSLNAIAGKAFSESGRVTPENAYRGV